MVLGAPCYATHLALNPKERVEYAQKRIEHLKSQLAAAKLLKKDTSTLEAEIKIAEKSLEPLMAHELAPGSKAG